MLLVGEEHMEKVPEQVLTGCLLGVAAILIIVALYGKFIHKAWVGAYILLP